MSVVILTLRHTQEGIQQGLYLGLRRRKSTSWPLSLLLRSFANGHHSLEPYRDSDGKGSDVLGPRNLEKEHQNRDLFRPPVTDHGKMANMKW